MAYAPIMLLIGLGGCAVAREEARLTFNDHILQPGEPRAEVERAFGKPDSVVDRNGREVVRYSTSKVDDGARHKLASSRAGIDLFTLGAFEIADPVAMSEDERKIFTITYQDGLGSRLNQIHQMTIAAR